MTGWHGAGRPGPALLSLLLCLSAAPIGAADIFLAPGETAVAAQDLFRFDSLVQWDYRHRQRLRGWKSTAQVIHCTLDAWSRRPCKVRAVENTIVSDTHRFFRSLPGASADGFRIVYLAAHQSPRGFWDMPREKSLFPLATFLPGTSRDPHRLVVLDACHASAAAGLADWGRFAPLSLFSCAGSEETSELDLTRRQPVDFKRRYPETVAWLRQQLGGAWDGRLSYLGFIWVRAFQQTPHPPASREDWQLFLRRCELEAASFKAKVNKRLSSTVRMAVAEPEPGWGA